MKQQSQSLGESFVKSYYKRFDDNPVKGSVETMVTNLDGGSSSSSKRATALNDYYQPDAAIVWNGLPFNGFAQFKGLLDQHPST